MSIDVRRLKEDNEEKKKRKQKELDDDGCSVKKEEERRKEYRSEWLSPIVVGMVGGGVAVLPSFLLLRTLLGAGEYFTNTRNLIVSKNYHIQRTL